MCIAVDYTALIAVDVMFKRARGIAHVITDREPRPQVAVKTEARRDGMRGSLACTAPTEIPTDSIPGFIKNGAGNYEAATPIALPPMLTAC